METISPRVVVICVDLSYSKNNLKSFLHSTVFLFVLDYKVHLGLIFSSIERDCMTTYIVYLTSLVDDISHYGKMKR